MHNSNSTHCRYSVFTYFNTKLLNKLKQSTALIELPLLLKYENSY